MHPEGVGAAHGPRSRTRRKTVENEEARAWVRFYRRVGDAAIAAEVLALLESDAETCREHPALVLLCRESIRRHKAWQQRRRRLAQIVRLLFDRSLVAPAYALRRAAAGAVDLLVECFRPSSSDRARAKVRELVADPGFAAERAEFAARQAESSGHPPAVSHSRAA